jgi:RNA-directed DNA polymerase
MADDEKAKLYKQIVKANRHVVMERMRATGFWPTGVGLPEDPEAERLERQQIDNELQMLRKQHGQVKDPEKALREERIRRWQASKQRRALSKQVKEAKHKERIANWEAYKKSHVVHLGTGYSAGLRAEGGDVPKLIAQGLPVLESEQDVASALGITLGKLRWLTFHRKAAALVHYHRYDVPKKTGGVRRISAPKASLATAQQWVLKHILEPIPAEGSAHGFIKQRSILTNAHIHVGHAVVINFDIKDFFPSTTFRRVKGVFRRFGYNELVATLFALLCTEPPRAAAELDGKVYHVALGDRTLPQGACTSPAITNILCRKLDRRLAGLARRCTANYTRYADDLTFSCSDLRQVPLLLRAVKDIVRAEGYQENAQKTHVMRKGRRQEVTGLTVNQKLSAPRATVRKLRAILHNAAKYGIDSQNRDKLPNFAAHLQGHVAYMCMIDPERSSMWRKALADALRGTKLLFHGTRMLHCTRN